MLRLKYFNFKILLPNKQLRKDYDLTASAWSSTVFEKLLLFRIHIASFSCTFICYLILSSSPHLLSGLHFPNISWTLSHQGAAKASCLPYMIQRRGKCFLFVYIYLAYPPPDLNQIVLSLHSTLPSTYFSSEKLSSSRNRSLLELGSFLSYPFQPI